MAIDVTSRIEIQRPPAEVAAILEEPVNDHRWIRALGGPAEVLTPAPYGKGTRVRRVARMAGRTIDYTTEIVEHEPGRRVVMQTVGGGLPMLVTYTIAPSANGTSVTIRNQGGSGPLFRIFGPLIGRMVRSRVDSDLRALKALAESKAPSA